jgi:hypothetical protein
MATTAFGEHNTALPRPAHRHSANRPTAGQDPNQDVVDAEYKLLRERILPLTK